jgi:hypothetical protein
LRPSSSFVVPQSRRQRISSTLNAGPSQQVMPRLILRGPKSPFSGVNTAVFIFLQKKFPNQEL